MGDSNPQHPDLESGALPLELIAYKFLPKQEKLKEGKLTVSSLYVQYALYTIYSIFLLKIFLYESFCF